MSWDMLIREAVADRRQLHRIPELCWQEEKTGAYIASRLERLGVSWRKCAGTGLLAHLAEKSRGEHVCLRCDMDGVPINEANTFEHASTRPNCMHGCGHDGHMATMLATLAWLKEQEPSLPGPVTFLFQPAEEGGHGAREMIADGALEGVDRIFGWHNWPAIDFGKAVCTPGPLMAANASFEVEVLGRGGHASQPELCRDPVLAASAITVALQQVVSRQMAPQRACVLSVTSIDGCSSETVIPEKVQLAGSVRAARTDDIAGIGRKITEISHSVAAGYGVEAVVRFENRYQAVINDAESSGQFGAALKKIFGSDWQCPVTEVPIMASEDFSYYLAEVSGAFSLVGAGDGRRFSVPCHNVQYEFNDLLIEPMVRVMSCLAGASDCDGKSVGGAILC